MAYHPSESRHTASENPSFVKHYFAPILVVGGVIIAGGIFWVLNSIKGAAVEEVKELGATARAKTVEIGDAAKDGILDAGKAVKDGTETVLSSAGNAIDRTDFTALVQAGAKKIEETNAQKLVDRADSLGQKLEAALDRVGNDNAVATPEEQKEEKPAEETAKAEKPSAKDRVKNWFAKGREK